MKRNRKYQLVHFVRTEATQSYLAQLFQGGDKVVVTHKGQGAEHVDSLMFRETETER